MIPTTTTTLTTLPTKVTIAKMILIITTEPRAKVRIMLPETTTPTRIAAIKGKISTRATQPTTKRKSTRKTIDLRPKTHRAIASEASD